MKVVTAVCLLKLSVIIGVVYIERMCSSKMTKLYHRCLCISCLAYNPTASGK